MKDVTTIGIDLAKDVFQIHYANERGQCLKRKRVSRHKLAETIAVLPKCLIGMEACGGSHHWARKFLAMGHDARLMPPQFVKPYVKGNKTDVSDAEGINEAVTRPNMVFVGVKSVEQQTELFRHRIRSRLVGNRTKLSNQARGLLHELGIVMPKGKAAFQKKLLEVIKGEIPELTPNCLEIFGGLYQEYNELNQKISECEAHILSASKKNPKCVRLQTIPGIGPITATALQAHMGDPQVFKKGRQVSAWLGLVPKQSSSGNSVRLLGISKRGDCYIRSLLVHGARSVIRAVNTKKPDSRNSYEQWVARINERLGWNKASVAIANKNARIAWAVLQTEMNFEVKYAAKNMS